jgi:signal transduction histidine kinase
MSTVSVRRLLFGLRHPQTTVRWRLTLLYGGLFLACGAALLAVTYALVAHATTLNGPRVFARAVTGPPPHVAIPPGARGGTVTQTSVPSQFEKLLASGKGRKAIGFVVARQRGQDLNQLEIESGIALAIMAIISALLGWLVAGRVLRPLRTITSTAQEISEANLHRRLALSGPRDELRQLADTIDGLLARLEGAFDAQRRFVANASHELRTPLTAARALLEMVMSDPRATIATYRETCQQVLRENEYQEQLIEALLMLAQGQRGLDRHEQIDLAEVVQRVAGGLELDAATSGLRMEVLATPVLTSGNPRLIERLVSNLLENAIRHNIPGGEVKVSTGPGRGGAVLRVRNTGAVIPADEVERLLQPFQRLSRERIGHDDGLGLGLSIIAAIATGHDAQLEVRPLKGGGLDVEVRFPLSPRRELVPEDLAQGVHGEAIDELDAARALERGEAFGGELEQPIL